MLLGFSFPLGLPKWPTIVNNFLLPVFINENPFDVSLSGEDIEVEDKLFSHFGRRTASLSGKSARMGK